MRGLIEMNNVIVPFLPSLDIDLIEAGVAVKANCDACGEIANYKITFDMGDDDIQMLYYCDACVGGRCKNISSRLTNYMGKMC